MPVVIVHGEGNPISIIPVPFLSEIIMNCKSKIYQKLVQKNPGKDIYSDVKLMN